MSRRYDDAYERDVRERRPRDLREMQQQDSRERMDPREQRRLDGRESDRMDYTRDVRSDLRATRDTTSRPMYTYPDQMDRDDQPPRGYADDSRERPRQLIDLQSPRREEASAHYKEYFLPGEDINREVIQFDICRYLGGDATVRPYQHTDVGFHLPHGPNHPYSELIITQGRQGYLIRAYRALTSVGAHHTRP
jgi:hypothetical protein